MTDTLAYFRQHWLEVPSAWLDVETTGKEPGFDRVVQIGVARFMRGEFVDLREWLINPCAPIPADATAVHGITDAMVQNAPTLTEVLSTQEFCAMTDGAQLGAFNAPFDRGFVPLGDPAWPWLDCLSFVRKFDRYSRGNRRHRLEATCKRHGIQLQKAHSAGADAQAAGELFYKLALATFPDDYTMGQALGWQRRIEAVEWFRFFEFKTGPKAQAGT